MPRSDVVISDHQDFCLCCADRVRSSFGTFTSTFSNSSIGRHNFSGPAFAQTRQRHSLVGETIHAVRRDTGFARREADVHSVEFADAFVNEFARAEGDDGGVPHFLVLLC